MPKSMLPAGIEKLHQDIDLARRELKNIRQELSKQKANMKQEVSMVKELIFKNNSAVDSKSNSSNRVDEGKYPMTPIGFIHSCFVAKNGIPRQPLLCPESKATLSIEKTLFTNPDHSLIGLNEFSHIWVLFVFHKNGNQSSVRAKVHPPRLNGVSTGVFSTRSPHRPCPIGLSLIKLDKIEGSTLFLSGIDLLDGTPVLDIKPFIPLYDIPRTLESTFESEHSSEEICSNESSEKDILSTKVISDSNFSVPPHLRENTESLQVLFTNRAIENLQKFHAKSSHEDQCEYCLNFATDLSEVKRSIIGVLKNDPRSVYRRQKCTDKLYYFSINNLHVTCWYDQDIVEVLKIKPFQVDV